METKIESWTPRENFGYKSIDDTDLALSLGHLLIYITVCAVDITRNYYNCKVHLSMEDVYDFDEFGKGCNIIVRAINNNFGYKPQEWGIIHKYEWRYSCSFTKKYRRR